jgi:hypothetical protein
MENWVTTHNANLRHSLIQERKISLLSNAIYYYLEAVFLINVGELWRLLVIQNGHPITDKCYRSEKAGKIAFSNLYSYKLWKKSEKPEWFDYWETVTD